VQDLGRLFWQRDAIRARLEEKLAHAFERVWTTAAELDVSLRSASLVTAIRVVAGALDSRGSYP
jgi:glutamate dehydrogenase/leucine dehydrogenase